MTDLKPSALLSQIGRGWAFWRLRGQRRSGTGSLLANAKGVRVMSPMIRLVPRRVAVAPGTSTVRSIRPSYVNRGTTRRCRG